MPLFPSKPTQDTSWTDGSAPKVTDPGSTKKALGWTVNERPPFQFINWLFWALNAWKVYFDGTLDLLKVANIKYVATVGAGAGCSHATIAAALADVNVPAGSTILVVDSVTLNTTVQISKNDITLEFLNGVTYTNGTAGTGIRVSATGARIKGGRFSGFTTAISVDAAQNYNFVQGCRFAGCTNDVTELDAAPINSINGNISE